MGPLLELQVGLVCIERAKFDMVSYLLMLSVDVSVVEGAGLCILLGRVKQGSRLRKLPL